MSAVRLMRRTVSLVRRTQGVVDDNGEVVVSDAAPEVTVGHLTQQQTAEGDGTTSEVLRLFLPPSTSLTPIDAVTVDGTSYEVEGAPFAAVNARTGVVSHVELTLRRAG